MWEPTRPLQSGALSPGPWCSTSPRRTVLRPRRAPESWQGWKGGRGGGGPVGLAAPHRVQCDAAGGRGPPRQRGSSLEGGVGGPGRVPARHSTTWCGSPYSTRLRLVRSHSGPRGCDWSVSLSLEVPGDSSGRERRELVTPEAPGAGARGQPRASRGAVGTGSVPLLSAVEWTLLLSPHSRGHRGRRADHTGPGPPDSKASSPLHTPQHRVQQESGSFYRLRSLPATSQRPPLAAGRARGAGRPVLFFGRAPAPRGSRGGLAGRAGSCLPPAPVTQEPQPPPATC